MFVIGGINAPGNSCFIYTFGKRSEVKNQSILFLDQSKVGIGTGIIWLQKLPDLQWSSRGQSGIYFVNKDVKSQKRKSTLRW